MSGPGTTSRDSDARSSLPVEPWGAPELPKESSRAVLVFACIGTGLVCWVAGFVLGSLIS
jgi:hypothetical protein